jgi:hypothetical protein
MSIRSLLSSLVLILSSSVLSVALFCAVHPESLLYITTRYLGGSFGDGGLYVWLTSIFVHSPVEALRFETNALYPYPLTRAWSDSFILPGALVLLLTKVGISFQLAYNTTLLTALGLNGGTSALLGRRIGLSPWTAILAGVLVANSPFLISNLGHPQLLFFFWIPLAWALVLPSDKESIPSKTRWFLSGIAVTGAFYCAVYYAIFACLGLGLIWFRQLCATPKPLFRALSLPFYTVMGALPILYAAPFYLSIQNYFGERRMYEAAHFAAQGISYLSYSPLHAFFNNSAALSHSEAHLSAGYSLLLIALLFAAYSVIRNRSIVGGLLLITIAVLVASPAVQSLKEHGAMMLSSGGWLSIGLIVCAIMAHRSSLATLVGIAVIFFVFSLGPGQTAAHHSTPYAPLTVLYHYIPGLSAIRAVGRMGVVPILVTTLVGMLAVQSFWMKAHQSRSRYRAKFILIIPAIFLIDLCAIRFIPIDAPPKTPEAFKSIATLSPQTTRSVVIPFSPKSSGELAPEWNRFAMLSTQYALWNKNNPHATIVNGYSGQRSKIQKTLSENLAQFPDEKSFAVLGTLCGIDSIIVVPSMYTSWNQAEFVEQLELFKDTYADYKVYKDGSILISLKPLIVSIPPNKTTHIFTPRDKTSELTLQSNNHTSCPVTIRSIGLDSQRKTKILQTNQYQVANPQRVRSLAPNSLSAGAPHVLALSTDDCTVEVSCSILSM